MVANCAIKDGLSVEAVSTSLPKTKDSQTAHDVYINNGGKLNHEFSDSLNVDLVVDALLGTGIDRPPSIKYSALIDQANKLGIPIVSLDIPSGLDSNSGIAYEPSIHASTTVTFIANKIGLFLADGKY